MAITGNGNASKEQVADLLRRYLNISPEQMLPHLDATDGLAAAYCHFCKWVNPSIQTYKSWKDFYPKIRIRLFDSSLSFTFS